jgi:hypothetical protein
MCNHNKYQPTQWLKRVCRIVVIRLIIISIYSCIAGTSVSNSMIASATNLSMGSQSHSLTSTITTPILSRRLSQSASSGNVSGSSSSGNETDSKSDL